MGLDLTEQQMIAAIKDATKKGVTVLDLLIGVRYATAFDKRGFGRTAKNAARHCRRTMQAIVESRGHTPPTGNAVTMSIAARKLQATVSRWPRWWASTARSAAGSAKGSARVWIAAMWSLSRPSRNSHFDGAALGDRLGCVRME